MVKFTTKQPDRLVRITKEEDDRWCSFCGEKGKKLLNTWDDIEKDWSQNDICVNCAKQAVALLEKEN